MNDDTELSINIGVSLAPALKKKKPLKKKAIPAKAKLRNGRRSHASLNSQLLENQQKIRERRSEKKSKDLKATKNSRMLQAQNTIASEFDSGIQEVKPIKNLSNKTNEIKNPIIKLPNESSLEKSQDKIETKFFSQNNDESKPIFRKKGFSSFPLNGSKDLKKNTNDNQFEFEKKRYNDNFASKAPEFNRKNTNNVDMSVFKRPQKFPFDLKKSSNFERKDFSFQRKKNVINNNFDDQEKSDLRQEVTSTKIESKFMSPMEKLASTFTDQSNFNNEFSNGFSKKQKPEQFNSEKKRNVTNNNSGHQKSDLRQEVASTKIESKFMSPMEKLASTFTNPNSFDSEFSDGFSRKRKPEQFKPEKKKKFLSEEEYFEKKEQELEKELSNISKSDQDKLKEDFKKMFSTKGPPNYEFDSLSKAKKERREKESIDQQRDQHRERRTFVTSVLRNKEEIPNVKLPNITNERREGVFSTKNFDSYKDLLHPHLISCLDNKLNINQMTSVQAESIPHILEGKDCLIKSVTGSGKSLAILTPLVHKLQEIRPEITRSDGTMALIILPTRELVKQFYEPLSLLCKSFNRIIPGYLMGGENKHSEKSRLRKGINILVTTPGRLLDHLDSTEIFSLKKLKFLVIDEADRLYEAGFENSVKKIVDVIEKSKPDLRPQTILISATLSEGVKRLAGLVLEQAEFVDTCDSNSSINPDQTVYTLPENLEQHFSIVPAKLRMLGLCGFIIDKCSYSSHAKILIFMPTQDVVDYHFQLLQNTLNPLLVQSELSQIDFFKLHGNMEQSERMKIFDQYRQAKSGVLICTDVASRGVDLPQVDWVLQFSCPSSVEDYIHRVGRTARIDQTGKSIIFILPSEVDFVKLLQKQLKNNFSQLEIEKQLECMNAIDFSPKSNSSNYREQAGQLQFMLENDVAEDSIMLDLAKKAYTSYTRAYASYPRTMKDLLPFKQLHLGHLCKSFCLRDPPRKLGAAYRPPEKKNDKFPGNRNDKPMKKRGLPMEFKTSEFGSGI